jgi:hypothetical protein
LRAELGQVPTHKGDYTWWVKSATTTATIQCIKISGSKSMAVMIVTSNTGAEAKARRDGLRRRMNPNYQHQPDWHDPDKAQ